MPTQTKAVDLPAVHLSSLLFVCAFLPALLFKGPQIEFFAITQIVLTVWLGWVLLQTYRSGLRFPKSALALSLTLFWAWLALSLTWSQVPNISVINFWWVGSLVLMFWLYLLTPDRDRVWTHAAAIILVIALVLALMGIYQAYVLGQPARSVFETRNTHAAFMNLVAIPAAAFFLRTLANPSVPRSYPVAIGAVLYPLFLSMLLTASRGASLSLVIGLVALTLLTWSSAPRRAHAAVYIVLALAYLTTLIPVGGGELGRRLPELFVDSPRRIIWTGSWDLLQAAPWQGIGLGLFYLAYPPYRNPLDTSAGFFVHNDYLQIWIETGLPGLILLLSILAAALWLFVRALRGARLERGIRIEMAGLFCGLMAVAGHSVVDFNLYILSLMMASGLALARLQELAGRHLKIPSLHWRPSRIVGHNAYRLVVVLTLLIPVFYFVALGMANSYYEKGLTQARQGMLQEADLSLSAAQRLTPSDDRALIAHADLYRHAIALLPPEDTVGKKALYDDALRFLDRAQQANPLRGQTLVMRGRLYQQNPTLAGQDGFRLAAESFERALTLNPRLFQGRTDYANLLLRAGSKDAARRLLAEGVKHYYYDVPELIPFFSLTARLQSEAGRAEDARPLEDRVKSLEKLADSAYTPRGY